MMALTVTTLHLSRFQPITETVELLGKTIEIQHKGYDGSLDAMVSRLRELVGHVSAIGVEEIANTLSLGGSTIAVFFI